MLTTLYLIPVFALYELTIVKGDAINACASSYRGDWYLRPRVVVSIRKKHAVKLMEGTTVQQCRMGRSPSDWKQPRAISHNDSHDKNLFTVGQTRVETRADTCMRRAPEIN
jgi:hypothetical protein